MRPESLLVPVYVTYAVVAVALTIFLARTLSQNGQLFLEDVFADPRLARAVNHLLVVGFYLLNFGYAFLILKADAASDTVGAVEVLARKLGILLVSLGLIHFGNLYVFHRLRARARDDASKSKAFLGHQV